MKSNESSGPDGFRLYFFISLPTALQNPLSIIYTSFMSVGDVPSVWRSACVTPEYKSGISSSVTNYRPISLTCVGGKVMERVISCTVLAYLRQHGMITKQQHYFFLSRKSTTSLFDSLNDWSLSIKYKRYVDVAFVDFPKAFDSVSHPKLLANLKYYGITGNLNKWITSFSYYIEP